MNSTFKYTINLITPDIYSENGSNKYYDKSSADFATHLKLKAEEFDVSCKYCQDPGLAFSDKISDFEVNYFSDSEYVVVIASQLSINELDIFSKKLRTLLTDNGIWRNRFMFVLIGVVKFSIDVVIHQPIYFSMNDWKNDDEKNWNILFQRIQEKWIPYTDESSAIPDVDDQSITHNNEEMTTNECSVDDVHHNGDMTDPVTEISSILQGGIQHEIQLKCDTINTDDSENLLNGRRNVEVENIEIFGDNRCKIIVADPDVSNRCELDQDDKEALLEPANQRSMEEICESNQSRDCDMGKVITERINGDGTRNVIEADSDVSNRSELGQDDKEALLEPANQRRMKEISERNQSRDSDVVEVITEGIDGDGTRNLIEADPDFELVREDKEAILASKPQMKFDVTNEINKSRDSEIVESKVSVVAITEDGDIKKNLIGTVQRPGVSDHAVIPVLSKLYCWFGLRNCTLMRCNSSVRNIYEQSENSTFKHTGQLYWKILPPLVLTFVPVMTPSIIYCVKYAFRYISRSRILNYWSFIRISGIVMCYTVISGILGRWNSNREVVNITKTKPIGLKNTKETCYMNSMMQALSSSNKLIQSLESTKKNHQVSLFLTILKAINGPSDSEKDVEDTTNKLLTFMETVKWNRNSQQDAFQLLSFFINAMQRELGGRKINMPPKLKLLHTFSENPGYNKVQDHLAIAVPLCGQFSKLPGVELNDMLNAFFEPSSIDDGDNTTTMYLYNSAPDIMILRIQANEWSPERQEYFKPKYYIKYGKKLTYPFKIQRIVDESDLITETVEYELMAVVHHMGEVCGGHYITYRRNGQQWYLTNDEQVEEVDFDFKVVPYIMVYEKC